MWEENLGFLRSRSCEALFPINGRVYISSGDRFSTSCSLDKCSYTGSLGFLFERTHKVREKQQLRYVQLTRTPEQRLQIRTLDKPDDFFLHRLQLNPVTAFHEPTALASFLTLR